MRVIATTCVRNEADIIEPFVRHTLAYCGTLIVMDHGSTDATGAILDQLQKEGLPLHVIRNPVPGRLQVDNMNHLLNLAARDFAADWIFFLDADEFISGSADLPFPVDDSTPYLKMRMRTYYSKPDDPAELLNPVERITRRLIREPMDIFKVIVPGPLARQPGCYLVQGNHRFMLATREAPSEVLPGTYLAHFSLRSPGQYAMKLAAGHLQGLRRIASRGRESSHREGAYARLRSSYSAFEKDFFQQPVTYLPPHDMDEVVADPVRYMGGPLRYTPRTGHPDEFVEHLLALAEVLAQPDPQPHEAAEPGYPTLSVGAFAESAVGGRQVQHVSGNPATVHSLVFALDCTSETRELRLCFGCEPGLLEISGLTLRYKTVPPVERTYGFDELKDMLRVLQHGAAIASSHVYQLFISSEPVLVAVRNWRHTEEMPPHELQIKVRYRNHLLEGVFLHPRVLNAITRESAKNETLRAQMERVRYSIGSEIDFSDQGDGVFFLRNGWSNSESWGTWTEGREAVLKIRFASAPGRDLCLNAVVRAFVQPSHPEVRANIRVNGEVLAAWRLTNGDFGHFRITIPARVIPGKDCKIALEISNPISPRETGLSDDVRLLGLGFKSMNFRPATPA